MIDKSSYRPAPPRERPRRAGGMPTPPPGPPLDRDTKRQLRIEASVGDLPPRCRLHQTGLGTFTIHVIDLEEHECARVLRAVTEALAR